MLTLIAAKLEAVDTFRQGVLAGQLLDVAEVQSWIQEQARLEAYTVWLECPVRPDAKGSVYTNRPVTLSDEWPATDFQLKWLHYILPGHKSDRVATAAGGALDRLRLASEQVAAQTGCSPDYATTFILSGQPLPYFSCAQTVALYSTGLCSALNRIELKIDPALSPRQVAEVYRELRSKVFRRRYRAMSEKHIRLALFTLRRNQGETLRRAMSAWNKLYPKWRYRQETNFGRDQVVAKRRALATLDANPTSQHAVENWLIGKQPPADPSASSQLPISARKRRTR